MKKVKQESPLKIAKKKLKDTIQKRLAKTLKAITSELGQDENHPGIDIEKESKKLAKKITKHLTAPKDTAKEAAPAATKTVQNKAVKPQPTAKLPVAKLAKAPENKVPETKPAATKTHAKNGSVKAVNTAPAKTGKK